MREGKPMQNIFETCGWSKHGISSPLPSYHWVSSPKSKLPCSANLICNCCEMFLYCCSWTFCWMGLLLRNSAWWCMPPRHLVWDAEYVSNLRKLYHDKWLRYSYVSYSVTIYVSSSVGLVPFSTSCIQNCFFILKNYRSEVRVI